MLEVRQTKDFSKWFAALRDKRVKARILARVDRLESGNAGDAESVGGGVSEMRIHYGPGYRVYFFQRGAIFIVLLCGGNKKTQQADIAKAKMLAKQIED